MDRQIAFWVAGKSKKIGNIPYNKALHRITVTVLVSPGDKDSAIKKFSSH